MALRDASSGSPTTRSGADRLRLTGPAQIVSAVPYLVGFRPVRSGVLVCLRSRLVGLTMRFDLSDVPGGEGEVHAAIRSRLSSERADTAILVLYEPPALVHRGRPGGLLADELTQVIRRCDVDVHDVIGVCDGRYWSYLCRNRRCCPPHGHPVPDADDPDFTQVAARFVAAGVSPVQTREQLAAGLEPGPAADTDGVRRALVRDRSAPAGPSVGRWRTAVDRFRGGPPRPGSGISAGEATQLVADVYRTSVRDEVISWCDDRAECNAVLQLSHVLAPLAPEPFHTQLLAVLAWAAYCAGEGALAGMALDLALRTDPDHSLSRLLRSCLYGGVRPAQLRELCSAGHPARTSAATRSAS